MEPSWQACSRAAAVTEFWVPVVQVTLGAGCCWIHLQVRSQLLRDGTSTVKRVTMWRQPSSVQMSSAAYKCAGMYVPMCMQLAQYVLQRGV